MASNSSQMNYSSKVGSSSMTSTSNAIKDVYVDAMVDNLIGKNFHLSIEYEIGCIKNHQTCT